MHQEHNHGRTQGREAGVGHAAMGSRLGRKKSEAHAANMFLRHTDAGSAELPDRVLHGCGGVKWLHNCESRSSPATAARKLPGGWRWDFHDEIRLQLALLL